VATAAPRELRPVGGSKLQADDKSFDFELSDQWTLSPVDSDAALLHATARRESEAAFLDVSCKLGKFGKQISAIGSPEAAARALVLPAQATLRSAEQVPGSVRGSFYYVVRYDVGGRAGVAKLGVQQDRLYRLVIEADELDSDVEAIIQSFQCFPINFICMGRSNAGQAGGC
jgi:hypothetical protein